MLVLGAKNSCVCSVAQSTILQHYISFFTVIVEVKQFLIRVKHKVQQRGHSLRRQANGKGLICSNCLVSTSKENDKLFECTDCKHVTSFDLDPVAPNEPLQGPLFRFYDTSASFKAHCESLRKSNKKKASPNSLSMDDGLGRSEPPRTSRKCFQCSCLLGGYAHFRAETLPLHDFANTRVSYCVSLQSEVTQLLNVSFGSKRQGGSKPLGTHTGSVGA